jgi:hypothetical protein
MESEVRMSPATILRDCAERIEGLTGEYLRGVISKRELKDAAAWLQAQAIKYDSKGRPRAHPLDAAMMGATPKGAVLGGLLGGAKQARIPHTCRCGRVIYGNGGFASHRKSCEKYIDSVTAAS